MSDIFTLLVDVGGIFAPLINTSSIFAMLIDASDIFALLVDVIGRSKVDYCKLRVFLVSPPKVLLD